MSMNKHTLIISTLLISLFVFLNLASKVSAAQHCTLDIYLKDQDDNHINGDIYVDDSYRGYDDHISLTVVTGTHEIEVRKSNYESNYETITCGCSETRRVDLILNEIDHCNHNGYMVDVGSIEVDNEYPDKGDMVQISVPITSDYDCSSKNVYVYGYIDNKLIDSTSMRFDEYDTMTYQFTIDTDEYSNGQHTIKVRAEIGSRTDTSTKTFYINHYDYYSKGADHCLSIENSWTDGDLKAGESTNFNVKVKSCGEKTERNVKMKLEAFSKTYYTGAFETPYDGSKDVFVTINVPSDASEKQTFKVTVWNGYTSDTWSKEFTVYGGIPFIDIKPEFVVENCQRKRIGFDVINNGKVADTFTLSLSGSSVEWITGLPETITLNPGERKTVIGYVSIPCTTEPGYYELTINAKGSPEHTVTSTIHVVRSLKWPSFPTGVFVGVGAFCWLPWFLIFLIILVLLLFFLGYFSLIGSRRRPMFNCVNGHGC